MVAVAVTLLAALSSGCCLRRAQCRCLFAAARGFFSCEALKSPVLIVRCRCTARPRFEAALEKAVRRVQQTRLPAATKERAHVASSKSEFTKTRASGM